MAEHRGRLTLWAIEAFLAADETGAITAAARRFGVSASGVSQQIAALEEALGVALFDRSARPMTLTPAGKVFRRHARVILNEVTAARSALGRADLAGPTSFRLGMIEDFEAEVTPRLLTAMGDELAGCRFLLETGPSHRLHDQLDARALDVIVAADIGTAESWMELHPLLEEPFVAAVPRGRVAAGAGLEAFGVLPLILYTARHHMGRQIRDHLAHQNLRLSHRYELDSYHAIMAMVAEGAGWAILTPLGFRHAARFADRVAMLPLPVPPFSRRLSLTARAGVLGDMPARVATRLRGLLAQSVVTAEVARAPWLANRLRVLGG